MLSCPQHYEIKFAPTQLSMKFQLLIKVKMLNNIFFIVLKISDVVYILVVQIIVKCVDILTFTSRTNFIFSCAQLVSKLQVLALVLPLLVGPHHLLVS